MQRFGMVLAAWLLAFAVSAEILENGDFMGAVQDNGVPIGWYADSIERHEGTYEVIQENGQGVVRICRKSLPDNYLFRISQIKYGLEPGKLYQFSVDVKGSGAPWAMFYTLNAEGTCSEKGLSPAQVREDEWQHLQYRFEAKPNETTAKISLIAGNNKGDACFRNASLLNLDEAPRCVLKLLEANPDGKLDLEAAEWKNANTSGPFTVLASKYATPSVATNVRFGLHGKTLYILYRCEEPQLDRVVNGMQNWLNDMVEVFLEDPETKAAYHFGVDSGGGTCSLVEGGSLPGYFTTWYSKATNLVNNTQFVLPQWHANTKKGDGRWIAQLGIELPEAFFKGRRQFRILFGRSRKLPNLEEYSSWGHTKGKFYRPSEGYVQVTIPPMPGELPLHPSIAMPPAAKPNGRIVPMPKRIHLGKKNFRESLPLKVYAAEGTEKALKAMERIYRQRFGTDIAAVATPKEATVVLKLTEAPAWKELNGLADWQRQEAYHVYSAKTVTLEATTHRGLVWAIQSLAQLSGLCDGQLVRRQATLQDWPDMPYRGYHLIAPESSAKVPEAEKVIDMMAALKMNWLAIQFDNRLCYERHPELSRPDAATKAEHRRLAALLDLYGMDVIPMTQCFSHFNYFLEKPQFREYAEVKEPAKDALVKYWNYCPRHPDIHKLVFDMIEEQLECYPQAKWFHVGMDEVTFEPIAVCERCKGATGGELFAEEALRLYNFLKKKNLRMCIWGDQLLEEHNGGGNFATMKALPQIPRDVVIFDWHYDETKDYPSVKFFKDKGFDVISSGWFYPENVVNFIDETFRQGVLGYGGTTWYPIDKIRQRHHLMSSMMLSGERCWARSDKPLGQIDFDVMETFRGIYDGADARRPKACRPLTLSPWFNMALQGGGSIGWLGLPDTYDLADLPRGLGWYGGIPFVIDKGAQAAIALAAQKGDMLPDAAWQIPVGAKVAGLSFLQTTSRPEKLLRDLYDAGNPQTPATYVIHYEDGSTLELPMRWNIEIADWNTQFGCSMAPVAWRHTAKDGTLVSLVAATWWNPKPQLAIQSIDFVSNHDKVQPVLLAVTAIEN